MNYNFEKYKVKKIDSDGILFDNGAMISDYHEQDCCESVYCDFEQADDLFRNAIFTGEPIIEGVEESGIKINGYFIPCYNSQNGYYSSALELQFNYRDSLNISNFVKDEIF